MENSSSIDLHGITGGLPYDVKLSPLHGDSFYNPQDGEGEDHAFSIGNSHVISESDSSIRVRWEILISGSLDDSEFEQQLVYGLGMILMPFSIRNDLVSGINGLVQRRPSASTYVSVGVRAVINLSFDRDGDGEEEEEEEDEEDNEFLHDMEMHRESLQTSPMTSSLSRGFVVVQLESVRIEGDEEDRCTVCLEEFIADFDAAKLPCSHVFHDGCVRGWLENRGTCPICRSALSVSAS